jgi:hypothetical protein
LFKHLKKKFDLPTIAIDPADGGGSKEKVVGYKL